MKKEYTYLITCITLIVLIVSVAFSKNILDANQKSLETKQNTYKESNPEIIDDENVVAASVTVPLTITNKQNDDVENEYTYYLTINEVSGAQEAKIDGKTEYIVFDAKGNAEISLKNNTSITFLNLPMDVEFTIKQDSKEGYITKINNENKNSYKGTLTIDNRITFENNNPSKESNPETVDSVLYIFITLLIVSGLIIILKNLKFKKYNN